MQDAHELADSIGNNNFYAQWDIRAIEEGTAAKEKIQNAFSITYEIPGSDLIDAVKTRGPMEASAASVGGAVRRYLDSEIRDPWIDRILLAATADAEITQYLSQMVSKHIISGKAQIEELKQPRLALTWLINRLKATGIVIFLVVAIIFGNTQFAMPPDPIAGLTIVVIVGGWVVMTLVSFVLMMAVRKSVDENRQERIDTLLAATRTYQEIHGAGPLSVARLRQIFEDADSKGVVWPGAIWTIFEDLEARGVRRF